MRLLRHPFFPKSVVIASCICGVLSTLPFLLQAQASKTRVERFSSEEGLPNETVLAITQDQKGFIWVGTQSGLAKYDGYDFLTYYHIPGDSTSLIDNGIEALFVDYTGDLWVGTRHGLCRYESDCDCFFRYHSDPSDPNSLPLGQINAFAEDQANHLWVGTQGGGLFRYERESDRFTRFLYDPQDPNTLINDQIRVLYADSHKQLWIGTGEPFDPLETGGGLIRFDLTAETAKRFLHDPENPNSLIDNRVSAILEDQDGRLLVGSCQSGLHYYDPEKEAFIRMNADPAHPDRLHAPQGNMGSWSSCPHTRVLHQSPNGDFWIGTFNGGLNHFDARTKKLSIYRHDPDDPDGLQNDMVYSFFEDNQGRMWIGTSRGGLYKIDPFLHKFNVYANDPAQPGSLSSNSLIGLYEAPGEPGFLWLGTRGGGLNRMDMKTGEFTHFRHDPLDPNSLSSDVVWTTYEDKSGVFWVGTENGLERLDRQTGKFSPFLIPTEDTIRSIRHPVMSIYEDREGILWLGTWAGGLFRLNQEKNEWEQIDFSTGRNATTFNSISLIHEDQNGMLWVGNGRGALYRYDRQKKSVTPYLETYGATWLLEDRKGWFWIGTDNKGLLHFNPSDGSFQQFTVEDGLPSNSIYSILEEKEGIYWISTGKGLLKFIPESNSLINYDVSDGLPDNKFVYFSGAKSLDGQLFFGTDKGLVSFFPDQVKNNPFPPAVLLNGLRIFGEPYDPGKKSLNNADEISLSYSQNDLTFEYVGLHYSSPLNNQYQYKLEPYDPDWIDAGTQRTARYTNLDPGQYTFQVIAANSDGLWNEEGASIQLYLRPPWWQTWWAYLLFGLTFLVAILTFLQWRTYSLRRQRQLLRQRVTEQTQELRTAKQAAEAANEAKSTFLSTVSHELRTPLTSIIGFTKLNKKNLEEKVIPEVNPDNPKAQKAALRISKNLDVVSSEGERLTHLINELLDLAKIESGKTDWKMAELAPAELIERAVNATSALFEQKPSLQMISDVSDDLPMITGDRDRLLQVLINLISNAVKFTDRGRITVGAYCDTPLQALTFTVSDTGSGIPADQLDKVFERFQQVEDNQAGKPKGTGLGLPICKEIVSHHGGRIWVESELGKGSVFFVSLSVKHGQ